MNRLISLILIISLCAGLDAQTDFRPLFNGSDLEDFQILNGSAEYYLDKGVIVGVSRSNTPNTFLATKKKYSDFILEFEVMVDYGLNSGVQIRSQSTPDFQNGRVHGYQVEIDTSPRRWSGGLYDEARRGWLYPLSLNPIAQNAFVNGTWNHYRIEAIGSHIRTFINGQACAYIVDDMTPEGFIAFQVHAIYSEEEEGKNIRWRNIKIATSDLHAAHQIVQQAPAPQMSFLDQQLTDDERRKGWRWLWDGESFNGWMSADSSALDTSHWYIDSGILKVKASSDGAGIDLITTSRFANFDLSVDFLLTEGSNSGIKYFVNQHDEIHYTGLEYQLLDNAAHPDASQGVNGNRSLAALYDLLSANNLSEPGNEDIRFKGIRQWNRARIISDNGHVEHWINGIKVVEYNRRGPLMEALIDKSKYANIPGFGTDYEGHILLQDHEDEVWFKNIKIREW